MAVIVDDGASWCLLVVVVDGVFRGHSFIVFYGGRLWSLFMVLVGGDINEVGIGY